MNGLLEIIAADKEFAEAETSANPKKAETYTIRSWGNILTADIPARECFLDNLYSLGTTQALFGQGGIGKSRAALNIGHHNVLQRKFCGLTTGTRPYRWLFLGPENSLHRWKKDITAMSMDLTENELKLLDDHIFLHAIETPEDAHLSLVSDEIKERFKKTLEAINPEILVLDPWNEVSSGDPNSDQDIRESMRELVSICRSVNPNMGILILHHGRTGRTNIAQAVGYDKGNFGKGSKALFSSVRAAINLAPADPDDSKKLIMVCGKSNDSEPFETRGIMLNTETMTYNLNPDFDLQEWIDDVEGKRRPKTAKVSKQDIIDAVSQGYNTHTTLCENILEITGAQRKTTEKWLNRAIEDGFIKKTPNKKYKLTAKASPSGIAQLIHGKPVTKN